MPVQTNVVEIVVIGTVPTTGSGTKNLYNVFHYLLTAGSSPGAVAVANNFLAGPWASVAAALSVAYTGVSCLTRFLDDALGQYVAANVPASGAVAGARLPTQSTVRFLLRGFTRGKSFRGAKSFGPIAESHVTNDELNATGLPLWQTVAVQLGNVLTPAGGSNFNPTVFSRSLSQTRTNPTTLIGSQVGTVLLNKTIGTLRRRKEKTVR